MVWSKLGGGGGDYVVVMDGECNRLSEAVSDPVSSEASLAPGLVK